MEGAGVATVTDAGARKATKKPRHPDSHPEGHFRQRGFASGGFRTLVEAGSRPLDADGLLELQRLAGNRAVTTLVQRKKKPPPSTEPEVTVGRPLDGGFIPPKTYEEMRSGVVLKPGKKGAETAKDTQKGNKGLLWDYVKKATLRSAQIHAASDILAYDYESLHELIKDRKETEAEMAQLDPGEKKNKAKLRNLAGLQKARGKIVNEPKGGKQTDFDGALKTSQMWAQETPTTIATANEDRTNVEMLYERVKRNKSDTGRAAAQEAKMSIDRMTLTKDRQEKRVDELRDIDRVQGAAGKISDAAAMGALSFLTSVATLGIAALEKQVNPLGYKGKGWTYHSEMTRALRGKSAMPDVSTREFTSGGKEESNEDKAARLVLMEDLFGKVKAVKKMLSERAGGASFLDWLSGILLFIGDGILQSLIAIGSRVAIWLGALSFILGLINVPAHGALSPVIAVTSALAMAITYVRLALSALKLVFTTARTAVDSLNLATNKDPRMERALQARTIRSGVGTVGDSAQVGGLGIVLGGDTLMGAAHSFTNAFNPVSDVQNVAGEHSQVLMEQLHNTTGQEFTGFTETTIGQEAGHYGSLAGGAGLAIGGVDVAPAIGEVGSRRAELYNPEHGYLGGSSEESHQHQEGEGYHGPEPPNGPAPDVANGRDQLLTARRGGLTQPPQIGRGRAELLAARRGGITQPPQLRRAQGGFLVPPLDMQKARLGPDKPSWLVEGTAAQEQLKAEGKDHLRTSADVKVKAISNAVSGPVAKVQDASDTAQGVSQKLQSVKDFFSVDGKKKDIGQDVPPDVVKKAEKSQEDSKDSAKLSDVLTDTAKALAGVGDTAKEGIDATQ
jgi:hypothetical protein